MVIDRSPILALTIQEKKRKPCCPTHLNTLSAMEEALDTIPLTPMQRSILQLRFLALLREYKNRSTNYSCSFNSLRIIISIGSLIVPALLSIQFTSTSSTASAGVSQMSMSMYWVVWVLSLCVTISNAIIVLLKIDKKYYTLNTTYQHLLSEGWQFVELSGKYNGFNLPSEISTHQNQFIFFCNILEKIRMRNVQDEFYKVDDHAQAAKPDQLVPPTPLKPIALPFSTTEKPEVLVNGEGQRGQEETSVFTTTVRKQQQNASSSSEEGRIYEPP